MGFLSKQREEEEFFNNMKHCNVGAAIGVAAGFVGSTLLGGGGGGGSAPDNNPGMIASAGATKEVAEIQAKTSGEYLDFYKKQYEEMKPILSEITNSQLATERANKERADEYAAYEKNTFRPLEQRLVREAENFNTDAKREELARTASADVSQAFGVARGQQGRQLAASGIRPDSNRFAALNNNLLVQEALARSGAQNKARTDAEGLGYARMQDAASLGRGLASNASTAYGVSLNAGNSAANNVVAGGDFMGRGYAGALTGYSQAANSYGTAGNIYGNDFNARMRGYEADVSQVNSRNQAIGSMLGTAGGFAIKKWGANGGSVPDGLSDAPDDMHVGKGAVKGPGSGIDDKVPAMLSNGEYVLPADTVQKIGKKNLDKIVKETHTPAAQQRRALKGNK